MSVGRSLPIPPAVDSQHRATLCVGVDDINSHQTSKVGFVAYVDRAIGGDLDERRLGEALEALLEQHRRRGSPAEELVARGATVIITRASRGLVVVRLGWLDDWPGETVRGGRMWLGIVALADISTERECPSPRRRPRFARGS